MGAAERYLRCSLSTMSPHRLRLASQAPCARHLLIQWLVEFLDSFVLKLPRHMVDADSQFRQSLQMDWPSVPNCFNGFFFSLPRFIEFSFLGHAACSPNIAHSSVKNCACFSRTRLIELPGRSMARRARLFLLRCLEQPDGLIPSYRGCRRQVAVPAVPPPPSKSPVPPVHR
jgi:hypothetical protein